MNILIAYGTTEGQTRKVAEAIADKITELGDEVRLYDTQQPPEGLHVESFDRVIVAGSVHERGHQQSVGVFVAAHRAALEGKPTLFVSVSLSAAFPDGMKEAQSYVDAFVEDTGWKPSRSLLVAGALQVGKYDYFQAQIVEHVVLKNRPVDAVEGRHEFTDWEALAAAVAEFVDS